MSPKRTHFFANAFHCSNCNSPSTNLLKSCWPQGAVETVATKIDCERIRSGRETNYLASDWFVKWTERWTVWSLHVLHIHKHTTSELFCEKKKQNRLKQSPSQFSIEGFIWHCVRWCFKKSKTKVTIQTTEEQITEMFRRIGQKNYLRGSSNAA